MYRKYKRKRKKQNKTKKKKEIHRFNHAINKWIEICLVIQRNWIIKFTFTLRLPAMKEKAISTKELYYYDYYYYIGMMHAYIIN